MTATEVIAKLKVDGASTFISAFQGAGKAVGVLGNAMSGVGGIMNTVMGVAGGNLLSSGIQSLTSGLMGFASQSVQAANAAEEWQMALRGMGNSAEDVQSKMNFINRLAIPSTFTASQLRESALMLEGMGIRAERALPAIAKITMGTGRGTREDLAMLAGMFGRMGTGQAPELEALSHFGITQKQLAAFGAIQGNAESMLNAIEAMANSKFGTIFETMANTGSAKLSSLADMWQQFMEKIGGLVMRWIGPTLDRLSEWGRYILQSGWLDKLVGQLASLGSLNGSWLDRPVALLMALAEKLPVAFRMAGDALGTAVTTAMQVFQKGIAPLMAGTVGLRLDRASQEALPKWMFGPGNKDGNWWTRSKEQVLADFDAGIKAREDRWLKGNRVGVWQNLTGGLSDAWNVISGRADQIMASMSAQPTGGGGVPTDPNPERKWGTAVAQAMGQPLERIASNTGEMASEMKSWTQDLRRFVVGGGGDINATPSEIGAFGRRAGRGRIPIQVDAGGRALSSAIEEIVQQAVAQLARQGVMQISVR